MALRIIQVTLPAERKKTIQQIAERHEAIDLWWGPKNEDNLRTMSILVDRKSQQDVFDSIQLHLEEEEGNWRAVILPVEASRPHKDPEDNNTRKKFEWRKSLTREELYEEVASGAKSDPIYIMMVLLSTIVAAIGLINDNVAIVIAAMVIAPLLGPNLALAFGTALGDWDLIKKSSLTCIIGLILCIIPSILLGFFILGDPNNVELYSRTEIGFSSIILALASGAAAVLSLTTGVSSALVGVMVSVALLPPAAAFGIFIGMGALGDATNSGLLLLTNLVCLGLSAQAVLIMMGIRPRKFLEQRAAKQSSFIQALICFGLLCVISVIIVLKN
jgi:uncharacterized hydrophobic protein (TIGR00341 family)